MAVLIIVGSLIIKYRIISMDKILEWSFVYEPKYNYQSCVTEFIKKDNLNLDSLCRACKDLGKKVKKSCYCFVVYGKNLEFGSECKISNECDGNVFLIKYELSKDSSFIEC